MSITALDGVVLVVTLLSAVLAMVRGFVREVLSIASWVAAAVAAYAFYGHLLPITQTYVKNPHLALALTIAGIFLVTLIVVSVITMKISDFVIDSRVGVVDRGLGFVFGAARGLLLVVVAMLFFNWLVPVTKQPVWVADARSRVMLDELGNRLLALLPSNPDEMLRERLGTLGNVLPGAARAPEGETTGEETRGTAAPADPAYGNNSRQSLDQLIQSSGGQQQQPATPAPAEGQPAQ
ncbi:CvpA family protein [Pseudoxanthobacter sp.]|uniref:CvpA family protein n=1 Tax=Pseudoxanthobacter sp. TaxID=1925742 RepID=UPI002FDFF2CC